MHTSQLRMPLKQFAQQKSGNVIQTVAFQIRVICTVHGQHRSVTAYTAAELAANNKTGLFIALLLTTDSSNAVESNSQLAPSTALSSD